MAIAAFLGLIVMLIPLYGLCLYSVPYYDDYGMAWSTRLYMKNPSDIPGAITGAVIGARGSWYAWEGLFAAKFLQGLDPLVFGEEYQFLGPILVLTTFAAGIFILFYAIVHVILRASWDVTLGLQSLAACQLILFIYSAQQGVYWYNGAVKYIGISGLAMMFVSSFIFISGTKKKGVQIVHIILGAMLGVAAGAGNFVTALHVLLLLAAFWLYLLIRSRETIPWCVVQTAVFLISFILAVVAPGNSKRAAFFAGMGLPPLQAILSSFTEGIHFLPRFLDMRTLLFLALYIPFLWKLVSERKLRRWFRLPWVVLVIVFSFCWYAAGFTPSLYSEGQVVLSRVINCIKVSQQLMMLLDGTFLLGWLLAAGKERRPSLMPLRIPYIWWILLLWIGLWHYERLIQPDPIGSYSSWGAQYYLSTGQADAFYDEYRDRVKQLRSGEQDVVFAPYTNKPWFLIWSDISTDPSSEENEFMAAYYGIRSVRLESE